MNNIQDLSAKKTMSKIGWALFWFMLLVQIGQVIYSVILTIINPEFAQASWYMWVVSMAGLYTVGVPVYILLMKKIPLATAVTEKRKFSATDMFKYFLVCYAATFVFNIVSTLINLAIGAIKGSPVVNPLAATVSSSSLIVTILCACIIAPICEEILFRKILMNRLYRFGERNAVIISALAFALFHGNLSQMLYAFVLGLIFGYITAKSGTIKYSIILHLIVNSIGTAIAPAIVASGNEAVAMIFSILVYVVVIAGIFVYIKFKKQMFEKLSDEAQADADNLVVDNLAIDSTEENVLVNNNNTLKLSTALKTPGMIAYYIITLVLVIFVIVAM